MNELAHTPNSAPDVQAGGRIVNPEGKRAEKVIVAVHGIGDQASFGTIQAVVNRFCDFFDQPAGVPLGAFHNASGAYSIGEPHNQQVFSRFAFAEVYWATVPRGLVDEKHKLEESKAWARTIVDRLRLRYEIDLEKKKKAASTLHADQTFSAPETPNFPLLKQVLGEVITTLGVFDRLCFLADKAGLFTFDLRKLFDDYLGDVQVVAEFGPEREKILQSFAKTMSDVVTDHPSAEIYIVAHSEGTVVAFLGLVAAFRQPLSAGAPQTSPNASRPSWAANVRGLMTIGSPIDKHLVLWPEIFGVTPPAPTPATSPRIQWRNYYDFGDPVGFELDGVRTWIEEHKWEGIFDFSGDPGVHDFGFTRYPLPGKAHVDYWNDPAVFGHFLHTVVGERAKSPHGRKKPDYSKAPATKRWISVVSYLVPYLAIAMLLFVAAYILLDATLATVDPKASEKFKLVDVAIRAAGVTALLAAITVAARLPRLTRRWSLRVTTIVAAVLGTLLFVASVKAAPLNLVNLAATRDAPTLWYGFATVIIVGLVSAARPDWGVKPLMIVGVLATVFRVGFEVWRASKSDSVAIGPLWPLIIAVFAFMYLWWLSTLMFDLVVVWHLYIRNFEVHNTLNRLTGTVKAQKAQSKPALASNSAPEATVK